MATCDQRRETHGARQSDQTASDGSGTLARRPRRENLRFAPDRLKLGERQDLSRCGKPAAAQRSLRRNRRRTDQRRRGSHEKKQSRTTTRRWSPSSWGGLAIAIVGVVAAIAGITQWDWASCRPPSSASWYGASAWRCSCAWSACKKQNDLVTYRELVAYSKGEPIDRNNPRSRRGPPASHPQTASCFSWPPPSSAAWPATSGTCTASSGKPIANDSCDPALSRPTPPCRLS